MNQVAENPTPEAPEQVSQGSEDKAMALESLARAEDNLGHVASSGLLHADESGNLLSERDRAELRSKGTADERRI